MIPALKGLTEIRGCYSGILARGPKTSWVRHLAMATPDAIEKLMDDRGVIKKLTELFSRQKPPIVPLDIYQPLNDAGLFTEIYGSRVTWYTFGIYTGDEESTFRAALDHLHSCDLGVQRAVFWGIHGVKTSVNMRTIFPGLYTKVIERLIRLAGDGVYEVTELVLSPTDKFDNIVKTDTSYRVTLSLTTIDQEPLERYPEPIRHL